MGQQIETHVRKTVCSLLIALSSFGTAWSQMVPMQVERCSAINPESPVYNIHVDKDGEKWVSNGEGLWQVHASNLASPLMIGSAESSLLTYPGGNADIRWVKGEINDQIGGVISEANPITSGYYNPVQRHLWIGTLNNGVYLFRTEPSLKIVKEIHRRMPKFRSNQVNAIYIDGEEDRHFILTEEGVVMGRNNRWGLEERYFRFQAVAHRGKSVWMLAEDLFWVVDDDDHWRTVEIDLTQVQGDIKDIAFDKDGRLWIASEYLTVYDIENNVYKIFDGADYFTSNNVNCIAVDKEGAVWVGTQDKGLYVIEKETAMTVTALVDKELSCDPNISDASLTVSIKGGQPPYTYQWEDDRLSGANPSNLGPGQYKLTVTDSKGLAKDAVGVVPNTRLQVTMVQNQAHIEDQRGGATAKVEGGTPKYTYLWDNGENGPTAERLEGGAHYVTITDANGCQVIGSIEISRQAGDLIAQIESTKKNDCEGVGQNEVAVTISGGIEPYQIVWSDQNLKGDQLTGLAAGTYYATVTDSENSTTTISVAFPEVEPLVAAAELESKANIDGEKGAATVKIEGGIPPYTYMWDNGENKNRASNLSAGSHVVSVTDEAGCQVIATVEITQETADLVAEIEGQNSGNCGEEGKNEASIIVSGGVEPYQITWSDNSLSGQQVSGLNAGTYSATITDAANSETTVSINFERQEPITLVASQLKAANLEGTKGAAAAEAEGGNGRFKYQWDNGETRARATNLTAGEHTVTVTDQEGCSATATVEITQEIAELTANINVVGTSKCAGDGGNILEVVAGGGVAPYNYRWSDSGLDNQKVEGINGGVYHVTVTDSDGSSIVASSNVKTVEKLKMEVRVNAAATANNEDGRASVVASGGTGTLSYTWSNGEVGKEASALAPGDHMVTVTDENGCRIEESFKITENISAMSVVINRTTEIRCAGEESGAIEAVVQGGKSPFKYDWNSPDIQDTEGSHLSAGEYSVTVSDAAGNTANANITIEAPSPLEAQVVEQRGVTDASTGDGKAELLVKGGTAPYEYQWDNGHRGEKVTNLTLGEHNVTVTDANGCNQVIAFETKKKILPALSLNKLRNGQVVQMQMLQFDADSTNVNESAEPILNEVYEFLKDNPGIVIRVEGHTNNVPPDDYCDKLSTARAKSVAEYIVQQGIAGERVYYRGYGKRNPIYSNRTADGRRKNQRVEIKILELGDRSGDD